MSSKNISFRNMCLKCCPQSRLIGEWMALKFTASPAAKLSLFFDCTSCDIKDSFLFTRLRTPNGPEHQMDVNFVQRLAGGVCRKVA